MKELESALVIDLAKNFISFMNEELPGWSSGYIRFHANEDSDFGLSGSYAKGSAVHVLDAFKHESIFDALEGVFLRLRDMLPKDGKMFCVALLSVNSDYDYDVKFEYKDKNKWIISKMDGGSGLPSGLSS